MSDNKEKDAVKSSSDGKQVAKSSAKKPSIFQRIGKFFKEYRGELKKISWPTFPEVVKNTIITMVVVVIIGAFIWVFDFGIGLLRDAVIASEKPVASASDVIDAVTPGDAVSSIADVTSPTDAASGADVTEG